MNPLRIIAGLAPFLVFSVLSHMLAVGPAALIAALIALGVVLADLKGGVKSVPAAGVIILGAISVVGFTTDQAIQDGLTIYGQAVATLLLAGFILLTAGPAPFTAQFARETTPREYWTSPTFVALNRRISTAWGVTVLAIGACHLIGSVLRDSAQLPALIAAVNWVLPVLAIVQAVKYTQRQVSQVSAAHADALTAH